MAQVDSSIFRKYDIRGIATGDTPQLTPEVARLVGQALGTYLPGKYGTDHMFVGCDNRLTSDPLKAALIEGVRSTGLNVTDIGPVLTPTVYYASASYGARGAGVQITGSHLDTRYNGIKMAYGKLALSGDQIQDLLRIIDTDAFITGNGSLEQDYSMILKHMETIGGMVTLAKPLTGCVGCG